VSKVGAVALSAVAMLAISSPAYATNGYFTHGVGTESKGMAGTGVGSNAARGSIIVASNPALGVFAGDGWELGMSFFSPMRSFTADTGTGGTLGYSVGAGSFDSSSELFPIPYVSKNWRLGNGAAITTAFYGRGGMNTDWDDSDLTFLLPGEGPPIELRGVFGGEVGGQIDAGVDLSQAFLAVTYSAKAGDNFAWGIGPVVAVQMFEAKGLPLFTEFTADFNACAFEQAPGTCDPYAGVQSLTNNGHDSSTGVGGSIGIWWSMGAVSAGLSYTSKISMSEFDDYSDLFAEDGGFDIPASTRFGLSFQGTNNMRVNLDVERTEYNDVASVGNPMVNFFNCPVVVGSFGLPGPGDSDYCLGGANGPGFGWQDMTTYKLGFEWLSDDTIWRFGYSYGEQPIPEADVLFNILAPGVMEQHITFGMSKNNWNFSLMYAPSKTVEGLSLFDPLQTIELEMKQLEFEFSYTFQ
jgi:long-chain fatty acid transport protein